MRTGSPKTDLQNALNALKIAGEGHAAMGQDFSWKAANRSAQTSASGIKGKEYFFTLWRGSAS
jgi:hypothetical protein